MKKLGFIFGLIALALVGLSAPQVDAACVKTADYSGIQCFTLYAGQTINAGTVCINVDGTNLKVTYNTTGGWELTEAHLWVGGSVAQIPQNKAGNPVPGQFPCNSGNITGQTTYTVSIPLDSLALQFVCPTADKTFYLAAHAAVRKLLADGSYQTETGWSEGGRITSKGNWATYSTFTLTCDCGGGPPIEYETKCETAFAYLPGNSTCFLDLGDVFVTERWGWTNGPLAPGSYTMQLWAGAAQCDTSKGTLVGTLFLAYDGATAKVTFDTSSTDWFMKQSQLYVGSDILPTYTPGKPGSLPEYTVAPGQFPYQQTLADATTSSYTIPGLSGNVYLVGHGDVCHQVPVQQ